MKQIRIYFNEEYLPSKESPQKILFLTTPTITKWFFDFPISVGVEKKSEYFTIYFIILGFGFIYNKNWDI